MRKDGKVYDFSHNPEIPPAVEKWSDYTFFIGSQGLGTGFMVRVQHSIHVSRDQAEKIKQENLAFVTVEESKDGFVASVDIPMLLTNAHVARTDNPEFVDGTERASEETINFPGMQIYAGQPGYDARTFRAALAFVEQDMGCDVGEVPEKLDLAGAVVGLDLTTEEGQEFYDGMPKLSLERAFMPREKAGKDAAYIIGYPQAYWEKATPDDLHPSASEPFASKIIARQTITQKPVDYVIKPGEKYGVYVGQTWSDELDRPTFGPGSSGSPLIDRSGNLLGVHFGSIHYTPNERFSSPMSISRNALTDVLETYVNSVVNSPERGLTVPPTEHEMCEGPTENPAYSADRGGGDEPWDPFSLEQ